MSILEKAEQERCFYCADGSVLCNVYELEKKLHTISEQAYGHHARQDNNDFSNWIRDVFWDYELAAEIKTASDPKEAAAIVKKHLSRAAQSRSEIESAIKKALSAKAVPAKPKLSGARKSAAADRAVLPKQDLRLGSVDESRLGKTMQKRLRKARRKPKPARRKNRKVNKKGSKLKNKVRSRHTVNRTVNKRAHKRGTGTRHKNSRSKRRIKKTFKRQFKKQVKQWLKWLKIVPELS